MAQENGSELFFSDEKLVQKRRIYSQYMVQGVMLTAANFLIFGAILHTPSLRRKKPYIIVAGLALIDLCLGIQLIGQSTFRNIIIAMDLARRPISPLECSLQPWNMIANLKDAIAGPMMLVQSIDRILAISMPLEYNGWSTTYALRLVSMPYLLGFVSNVMIVYHVWHVSEPQVSLICTSSQGYRYTWPEMYQLKFLVEILTTTASVALYIVVLIIMSRHNPLGSEREQQEQIRQQRRLTITVGTTSFFTLLLHTSVRLVNLLRTFVGRNGLKEIAMLGGLLYLWDINGALIRHMNPFLNVFIYVVKQKEMRIAIKYLVKCKKLTPVKMEQEMNKQSTTVSKRQAKVAPREE